MLTIKNRRKESRETLASPGEAKGFEPREAGSGCSFSFSIQLQLALVFSIGIFSGCTPAGPKALLDGKRLIEQAKYARAIEKLHRATSLLSTNAQAWNYLGLAYHYAGKTDEAERAYRRALALNHDLTESHYNLACLWLPQNRPEKNESAKTELLAYTLRRGNTPEGLLKLGLAQLRLRELTGAEKSFSDALRSSPQSPESLNGLGLVRLQRGRADEAVKYFRAALKQQPSYRPALLNLAIVSQEYIKDRPLALRAFREYAALKPPPQDADLVRAIAVQLEHELNPPSPRLPPQPAILTNINRSVIKPTNTDTVRSASIPKIAVVTNPSRPTVIEQIPTPANLETVKLSAEPLINPPQDAPNPVSQAKPAEIVEPITRNPQPSEPLRPTPTPHRSFLQRINPINLFRGDDKKIAASTPLPPSLERIPPQSSGSGEVRQDAGGSTRDNTNAARYSYLLPPQPAAGNRSQAQPLFEQGVRAQQGHHTLEAIRAYREAIQMDPSFFEAHYNLGLTAGEAGDLPGALKAYENALAARSDSVDARYNFALALKQGNYVMDAAIELEKVLNANPKESRANLALGNLYAQQLGQPAKARQCYLRVLEHDPRNPQANAIRFWMAANPP